MLPIHFAPLQGYTEAPYRNAHARIFGGVEAYYTPFWRVEHGQVRRKDVADLSADSTGSVIPQIIVRDAAEFRFLVDQLHRLGHHRIDVNMGCPFPLQVKKGRGAGILQQPDNVKQVFAEMAALTDFTFSVKMRLGNTNSSEAIALLPLINDTPLCHVTMHPRIAKQQYKGTVNLDAFAQFIDQCTHPVIYNGDITSLADISQIKDKFPSIAGIMIGRGLLARPSLAAEYHSGIEMHQDKLLQGIRAMHNQILEHYSSTLQGDTQILTKIKTFWDYLEPTIGHRPHKFLRKSSSLTKYVDSLRSITN